MSLASLIAVATGLVMSLATAAAAELAGTIVTVEGEAQIESGGVRRVAAVGADVNIGDTIHTGTPGRVRIAFRDESTVNVGDGSVFTIDTQVFDPAAGTFKTYLKLIKGKVRALVSEYYEDPLASYEIETATAVSGVRGTEFVVTYLEKEDVTEVVGISGRIEVNSTMDLEGRSVFVTAGELSRVGRGRFPSPPKQVGKPAMRQYLDGLSFVGAASTSMLASAPTITANVVPAESRASSGPGWAEPHKPPRTTDRPHGDRSTPSDISGEPTSATGELLIEF